MSHLIPIDEVVHFDVCTHVASTGAVSDADSAPTFSVYEEDTDTAILGPTSMTKRTSLTGNYRGNFTTSAANGFEAGKWYSVIVSATVSTVAAKTVVMHFRVAPAESSAGVPKGDVSHFGGTAGTFASGRPEVNTTHAAGTAWGSGAITAASIAADAITAAKIADGAIDAATFAAGAINAAAIAADAITDAKVASDVTIASVTGAVGSVTGNVGGNVTGSVGSIATGGISAASFAAGAIDAAAIATDAITSAELAASATAEIATAVRTELATELARIDVATSTRLASASYSAPPSAASVADAVWDEALSGHLSAGSTGEALNAAGAAGDPWTTSLPGAYSSGQAGYIIGTYLDAAISTRLATSGYTAPLSAAGTRTALGLTSANLDTQLDAIPTATENADALLNRDMSAVNDTNSRSPLNALRHIRNKWSVSGTTLTVTKEDDTTSAWTSTLSTNAAADPITGSDPA